MAHFKGGCLCGAIRYEVTVDPIVSGMCHCRDCQYVSGGSPALFTIMPRAGITITQGNPRTYWNVSARGNRVGRLFCGECGTPLFAENETHPEFLAIKVGSLDDPSGFKPQGNIWVSSAQPWAYIDPALPRFEKDFPDNTRE